MTRAHLIVYDDDRPAITPLPPDAVLIQTSVKFPGIMTAHNNILKVDVSGLSIAVGDLLSIGARSDLFQAWFYTKHAAGFTIKLTNWYAEDFMGTGRAKSGRAWVFHHDDPSGVVISSGDWVREVGEAVSHA